MNPSLYVSYFLQIFSVADKRAISFAKVSTSYGQIQLWDKLCEWSQIEQTCQRDYIFLRFHPYISLALSVSHMGIDPLCQINVFDQ